MSTLRDKLLTKLNSALAKQASDSDEKIIAGAEQNPAPEQSVKNPADAETGAASDIVTNSVGADGLTQPGTASEVDKVDIEGAPAGGIDAATVAPTEDGEAEKILDIKDGEVTREESIDMINKAASQIKRMGAAIQAEKVLGAFNKEASERDNAQQLLYKAACAGDTSAQHLVDMLASYELGLAKKAADLAEAAAATGAASPEEVAAVEDALNAEALQDPAALMEDADVNAAASVDDADAAVLQEALAEAGAEIENAAQEATIEVASELMDADPSLSEEEALGVAQTAVVDALQTMDVQQLLGAVGEDGEYLVGDEDAAAAVDELKKSASANPLRDGLVADLNAHFGITPDAFAKRLGVAR